MMGKNNYNRQSIRLKKFDYSLSGYYFITICTEDSERLFGKIINNEMVLNDFGEIVNFE
jgi:putative transposase